MLKLSSKIVYITLYIYIYATPVLTLCYPRYSLCATPGTHSVLPPVLLPPLPKYSLGRPPGKKYLFGPKNNFFEKIRQPPSGGDQAVR